jgi:hypothetical protein
MLRSEGCRETKVARSENAPCVSAQKIEPIH